MDRHSRSDDETTLISAAQRGDRRALDQLLRDHQDRIHAVCRRLAGNDADALDATQEALIAIVKGLPRFDGRAKFGTWAYRVATNACLDELRRRNRRPDPGLPEHEVAGLRPVTGSSATDPADAVSARIDVDRGLQLVPEEFRVAVVLRDIAGLDYAEIADVLDLAPGTVRSRIARGRARLAEAIGADASHGPGPAGNRTAPDERPSH